MGMLRAALTTALTLFGLAVTLVGTSVPGAAVEDTRFVPQLELTDLQPVKVTFAPDDDTLLMVVNAHGRIDIFDAAITVL
jgi:hypothetical protein